jgi:L-ascorbate metabolism protein UlaG (beta-lactamase superfamily)
VKNVRIRWYGQSAFTLAGPEHTVSIDPFGDLGALLGGRRRFDYPPVPAHTADVLLVTHEHADHNAVEAVAGEPHTVRSTAGRFETPLGEVIAIASEHDAEAGTGRGPNTIFVFSLDGLRVCHFGDFGQSALRQEQREAIGAVDLPFVPVGGGRRSTPPRPPGSPGHWGRHGSCPCTTARLRSTSSPPPTSSWPRSSTWRTRGPSTSSPPAAARPQSCTWRRRHEPEP